MIYKTGVSEEVVIEKSTETPAVVYTTTKKPPKKVPATTTPDYLPKSPSKPPHRTYPPIKPPRPEGEPPDTCDTSYDAISIIRGDIYIFKDKVNLKKITAEFFTRSIYYSTRLKFCILIIVTHKFKYRK